MALAADMERIKIKRSITAATKIGRNMNIENKALEQLTAVAKDYVEGFITLNEFNYMIDCIIGDVLLESGYEELYERFALLKEYFSPYWLREDWVIPQ